MATHLTAPKLNRVAWACLVCLASALSPALVRTTGSELGLRTEAIAGLQSSLALWKLDIGSELVFASDAGDTGASGASRRWGVEFNNHYRATPWLLLDADVAVSRAEFTTPQGDAPNDGRYVPGSVETPHACRANQSRV